MIRVLKKRVLSPCVFKMLKALTQNDLCTHINPSLTNKSIQAELTVISRFLKANEVLSLFLSKQLNKILLDLHIQTFWGSPFL